MPFKTPNYRGKYDDEGTSIADQQAGKYRIAQIIYNKTGDVECKENEIER